MPPGDDDVTIYGEFRDAISRKMREVAQEVRTTSRDLDGLALSGEAAAVGMDRSSAAAGRLKRELNAVERAAEAKRLADLRLIQAEEEVQRIRAKGVLNAGESARVEQILLVARRDAKRATDDLRTAHIALGEGTQSLGRRMLGAARDVEVLTTGLKVLRGVALLDMFTGLIGGVASLGAVAVGAVAGIAPLIGLAGGIPALGLAAVTAFGGIHLLTGGLGKASEAIVAFGPGSQQAQQALRGLTPEARDAAFELAGIGTELRGIKRDAQAAGLPYLHSALGHLRGLLPNLRTGAVETVTAVGQVIDESSAKISGWGGDLDTIFRNNASLVHTLGTAGYNVLSSLRHITIDSAGMTQGLAQDVANATERLDRWLAANPGKVTAFFDKVRHLTETTFHVIGAFGSGLVHILMGASPMVDHLGGGITAMADRFEEWASSAHGQESIHKFFRDAIPLADAFGRLIGTLGHNLGRLATGGAGGGLVSILDGVGRLIGPLTTLLLLITRVTTAIPGAGTALGGVALLMGIPTPFGRTPGLPPRAIAGGVRGAYRFTRGLRGLEGAAESPMGRTGMRVAGLFGRGGAAAAGAEEGGAAAAGLAPLLLNPIGAGILAATALAGLGVVLYRRWRPFHDLVDAVGRKLRDGFGWVEHHGSLIGRILLIAFAPVTALPVAVYELVKHFRDIEHAVSSIGNHLKGWVGSVGHAASSTWGNVTSLGGLLRYAGGPVATGNDYIVGEIGPELLVGPSGMKVIGGDGAELLRATEPGYVLPNTSYELVMDSLTAPVRDDGGYRPGGGDDPPLLPPMSIGPFYGTQNEAEVRRWVREGVSEALAEAQRRRLDRR